MSAAPRFPLVCFDVDGVLIDGIVYVWELLHQGLGSDPEALERAHHDFRSGVIDYATWFDTDLRLMAEAGADRSKMWALLRTLQPMAGAREVLASLRERGHRLGVVSGGLDLALDAVIGLQHFDHVLINRVHFDEGGRITGGEATPYDFAGKAAGLRELCRREGIDPAQAVFVGDHDNDVEAAQLAGLGVAFDCKSDRLRGVCDVELAGRHLRPLLELIG